MKRHDLDAVSLVAGLLFVTIGIAALLDLNGDIDLAEWWIGPAVLVAIGVAGILSVVLQARRGDHHDSSDDRSDTAPTAGP